MKTVSDAMMAVGRFDWQRSGLAEVFCSAEPQGAHTDCMRRHLCTEPVLSVCFRWLMESLGVVRDVSCLLRNGRAEGRTERRTERQMHVFITLM